MMKYMKISLHYIIFQPCMCIFLAFFQPKAFSRMYETQDTRRRLLLMIRLLLPLFLTSYIMLLIAKLIRYCLFLNHFIYVYNAFPRYFLFIPSYSILWAIVLGLFFCLAGGGVQFGITFSIGSNISFVMLNVFIPSFNPSSTDSYNFSFIIFLMIIFTGIAIGLLFACAFALVENESVEISTSMARCIGFGIALLIILFHLEDVDPQTMIFNMTNPMIIPAGIMGCTSAAIALTLAGDVVIPTVISIHTAFSTKVMQAATSGVIFGISFICALIPLVVVAVFINSPSHASDLQNLLMVSIVIGFVSSFLLSKKGTIARIIILITAMLIILCGVVNIFDISSIHSISLPSSPLSFISYTLGGIAFGAIAGSISWIVTPTLLIILLIAMLDNMAFSGDLAGSLSVPVLYSITVGMISGVVVSLIVNIIRDFEQGVIRVLVFNAALIIAYYIINILSSLNASDSTIAAPLTIYGICIGCLIGYALIYKRLIFYPISSFSFLKVYLAGQRNPLDIFRLLHSSVLYWDEKVSLPLPYVKNSLRLAMEQDSEQTLREISFIVQERPQLRRVAYVILLEITLRDLENLNSFASISTVFPDLETFISSSKKIEPRWQTPLGRLRDVSQDASRFINAVGKLNKYNVIDVMNTGLNTINVEKPFDDYMLNKYIKNVVAQWLLVVQEELKRLETTPEEIGHIVNPYLAGQPLPLEASLFVGRRDLVEQLEIFLSKSSHKPTFFLTGERRMGKSSTLNQLPLLLGARYIPITYDLQNRGISSSTEAFLGTLADEMYLAMEARGIQAKKLKYTLLEDASRKNEAAPYRIFDQWLKEMQQILKHQDRVLLLAFDEFEMLREAEQAKYLNVKLLLDWFRSSIQNYSQLAFLFSGVQTPGDMGPEWVSRFVNVQTLKVSFLSKSEAIRLVTKPTPLYPSEQLFGSGVVDEIIRVTGCHPFLVQAICSALIDNLNSDSKGHAELSDIALAVERVLENWGDTYFRDLWMRTTLEEQTFLQTFAEMGSASIQHIAERNHQTEKAVQNTLSMLIKRDFVLPNGLDQYQIAAPLFEQWIERSNKN